LLNHTSGLTAANLVDFYVMKSAIEAGISLDLQAAEHLGHYNYQNVNYALCRILLAVINGNISASASTSGLFFDSDLLWDLVTISAYQQYTVSNVFRPAGVFGATLDHPDAAGLAYRGPMDTDGGWNSGGLQSSCGADGWHLSINELLNVMSAFRRDRSIVAPEFAQQMLDEGFGVDPLVYPVVDGKPFPAGLTTLAGEVYCKNGRWMDAQAATRREEQCLAYFLPNDMELAIFANSRFPVPSVDDVNEPTLRDMVTQTIVDNLRILPPTLAQ
jgi:CubicO group peptidase (beta-lactamase class C family)